MTATKSFPSEICLLNIITIFERCYIAILLTFLGKNIYSKKIFIATSRQIAALKIRRQQIKIKSGPKDQLNLFPGSII